MKYFALIGAAGYIAPRHMQAIADTGNQLIAAVDPHDSAGALDRHFPEARFFTEVDAFANHLRHRRVEVTDPPADYVSICSPNYLHDEHAALGLKLDADVICEKPLALTPARLDALQMLERQTGRRVNTILQLRLLPALCELKQRLATSPPQRPHDVVLTYVTRRGHWYDVSWKGNPSKSGGVAMNIGIHFFDLLRWLFGEVRQSTLHLRHPRRMAGYLELAHARVRWLLSLEQSDLPASSRVRSATAYRSLTVDGEELEFTGFAELHTASYQRVLDGRGFGLDDARPAVELVHGMQQHPLQPQRGMPHPALHDDAPTDPIGAGPD